MANEKRLIYAEDLLKPVNYSVLLLQSGGRNSGKTMAMYEKFFRKRVEMAPTVDAVEVVHGRWIYKWDAERDPKKYFIRIVCSECNLHTGQRSNYCPQCGAKMDGDGNG